MLKSMTGYGRCLIQEPGWTATWEIKSVNNRHLDLKWKIPHSLSGLQSGWEKELRNTAKRGRVDIFLTLKITAPELQSLTLDTGMAGNMLTGLEQLAASRGETFTPDYNRFLAIPSLWKELSDKPDPALAHSLQQGLADAMADWDGSRSREGNGLGTDLAQRLALMTGMLEEIRSLAPGTVEERFQTIQDRVAQLLERFQVEVDQERMLQELAVLADKLDVSEEITRLAIHLRELAKHLEKGGAVGRKLDFVLQECFREINTCGNKIQNIEVGKIVVAFKAELEKCREQVQNIE
ncbi:MAG TPA: YicC/YloC family endoribonuclease [Desulfomicrobiaceae bacterium]|nr:YicC/YloC family endoribonuclease [Desulfomicrobiaceae bacterium]